MTNGTDWERRLGAAAELAVRIAAGDLHVRLEVSERSDAVDAVIAALNMLAEELQHERQSRRRAEDLLQDEIDGYEHAPALFCSVDARSLVVEKCNQTLTAALGRSKLEIIGRSLLELYAPDQRGSIQRALRDVPEGPGVERGDAELCAADGRGILVSTSVSRVRVGEQRERLRIIWRDVTKERRLEAQLRESQKLEALGRLSGGVAHDFNNILAVIAGAAGLAGDALAQRGLDCEDIRLIQQAVDRGASLINDLLAFSRRQVVKPAVTNVSSILEEAARMAARTAGPQIRVQTEVADPGLVVLIDPSQLWQVLINLAINARDSMRDGGMLRMRARRVDTGADPGRLEHPPSMLGDLPAGSYVLISVIDEGVGMAPNVLARALEPFFTTKPVGGGSGLGLSTCYGIIQQAGGRMVIESAPGKGTSVHVYLPRNDPSSRHAEPVVAKAGPSGRETILIVEDDPAVASVTRRILERAGYAVLTAESGVRALELMESGGEVALVITDLSMPGMRGEELGVRLQQRLPNLKVLYLSGYSSSSRLPAGPDGAAAEFLNKPFSSSVLLEKVSTLLAARTRGAFWTA